MVNAAATVAKLLILTFPQSDFSQSECRQALLIETAELPKILLDLLRHLFSDKFCRSKLLIGYFDFS